MTDTKIVTFKKEWRGYAIGEIAGFDSDAAASLIQSGRAMAYVAPGISEKAPAGGGAKKPAARKGGKAAETVDPVDPIDPLDPVDPIDPIDPVDPVDPVDPEEPDEKP
ncbi:hypothetical protein [Pseudomonas fluorescens]|uniref:Uncharacterized protein n=1 Tax=Pseudomonas fluorescens TaxID=294 RepID=A0A2T0I6K1_PSEFL|nr:hypothetical protein [Pseudomonas fluorescens]PRW90946.1 hypothetical protein C7A10_18125 [Pseudomonas fluorescens]